MVYGAFIGFGRFWAAKNEAKFWKGKKRVKTEFLWRVI